MALSFGVTITPAVVEQGAHVGMDPTILTDYPDVDERLLSC